MVRFHRAGLLGCRKGGERGGAETQSGKAKGRPGQPGKGGKTHENLGISNQSRYL
jgi:hypothetical protein